MSPFVYRADALYAEQVSLAAIVEQYGSPCYVYSKAALTQAWQTFNAAFGSYPHSICYAVKANSNLAILNILARLGSGFDIVSQGELERVLAAGGEPSKIVFSGVGKSAVEMRRALSVGIACFNIESAVELTLLHTVAAELNSVANISIRVNPNVDAKTHPYIATGLQENKFGVASVDAFALYKMAATLSHINIIGIDCHIGSQITTVEPFLAALDEILQLIDQLALAGITIQHLNMGGGLGVTYRDETPPAVQEYVAAILAKLQTRKLALIIEPGRAIVANAGVLLTTVQYLKHNADKHFAIVDAAMNDLLRPALYDAWQAIIPVKKQGGIKQVYDIVGPVCETGDFLGKERELILQAGGLLAIQGAGAYGFCMSSNYNSRPRVAEILVDEAVSHLIRERETIADLFAKEKIVTE